MTNDHGTCESRRSMLRKSATAAGLIIGGVSVSSAAQANDNPYHDPGGGGGYISCENGLGDLAFMYRQCPEQLPPEWAAWCVSIDLDQDNKPRQRYAVSMEVDPHQDRKFYHYTGSAELSNPGVNSAAFEGEYQEGESRPGADVWYLAEGLEPLAPLSSECLNIGEPSEAIYVSSL